MRNYPLPEPIPFIDAYGLGMDIDPRDAVWRDLIMTMRRFGRRLHVPKRGQAYTTKNRTPLPVMAQAYIPGPLPKAVKWHEPEGVSDPSEAPH